MALVPQRRAHTGDRALERLRGGLTGGFQLTLAAAGDVQLRRQLGAVIVEQVAVRALGPIRQCVHPDLEPGERVVEPSCGLVEAQRVVGLVGHGDLRSNAFTSSQPYRPRPTGTESVGGGSSRECGDPGPASVLAAPPDSIT